MWTEYGNELIEAEKYIYFTLLALKVHMNSYKFSQMLARLLVFCGP